MKYEPKECIICGGEFTPTRINQLMCSKWCRDQRKVQNAVAWQKKYPHGAAQQTCRLCGKPIEREWNRITNSTKFHKSCVIQDCKATLLRGEDLDDNQRQRLSYSGYSIKAFKWEVAQGEV